MQPPELVNMFAVPFAFSRCPAQARLNAALRRYILEQEKNGTSANPRPLTQRNAALFESDFNLFRDTDPAVQELKTFCWDQLLAVIGLLNRYDLQTLHRLQIYNDCWFHVTRRGGFFGVHNHPNASWITSAMHMDAGIARMQLPYGYQIASVPLEAGQLVLFPSWVLHDVKPYEGEGERITIAFNCWFTLPDT
jgi:hypothetical protein